MTTTEPQKDLSPAELITNQISELEGWRGSLYSHLRQLVNISAPELVEDWKWGTAVWNFKGNVLSIGVFKDHLKINFFKGAAIEDPASLFNAGLDAKASRSIDLFEGDMIAEQALAGLIRRAVAFHRSSGKK